VKSHTNFAKARKPAIRMACKHRVYIGEDDGHHLTECAKCGDSVMVSVGIEPANE